MYENLSNEQVNYSAPDILESTEIGLMELLKEVMNINLIIFLTSYKNYNICQQEV